MKNQSMMQKRESPYVSCFQEKQPIKIHLVPIPEPNLISFLDPFSTTKAHFPK
jgi:hypothetical protein